MAIIIISYAILYSTHNTHSVDIYSVLCTHAYFTLCILYTMYTIHYSIITGLAASTRAVSPILFLMLLLFFFFGVIGFYTFSGNDPFHFGTLPLAMITLLRQSVYENSGDIWYINTFGCDVYNDGIYVTNATLTNFPALYLCTPQASYILAPIYFLSFLIIVAFVVMSLFIGAISLSMSKALDAIDHSQREKARKKVCVCFV